jgi:hypothetical protein
MHVRIEVHHAACLVVRAGQGGRPVTGQRCGKCGQPVLAVRSDTGRLVVLEEGRGRWALQLTIDGAPAIAVRTRLEAGHRLHGPRCLARWRRRCVLL